MAGKVFCFHSMHNHCFTKIAIFAMFFQKKKKPEIEFTN